MPTLQAYENGLSLGWAGGRPPCPPGAAIWLGDGCCHEVGCPCHRGDRVLCCAHAPAKRGQVSGWSAGAVRRHTRWLQCVDDSELTGAGAAVTLTVRDCPATADQWRYVLQLLLQRLRDAGLLRWHWVVEWQARGVPHVHMAVYAPNGWTPPGWAEPPIMHTEVAARRLGWWVIVQWRELAAEFAPGLLGQEVTPINDARVWSEYVSKHAARGVNHYQRQGKPDGWDKTGRLWGFGGDWPVNDGLKLELTTTQAHQLRRLVKRWRIARVRSAAFDYEARGLDRKAASAWATVGYLRRMLKSSDRRSSGFRGMSEWGAMEVTLRLAEAVGWEGALAEVRGG